MDDRIIEEGINNIKSVAKRFLCSSDVGTAMQIVEHSKKHNCVVASIFFALCAPKGHHEGQKVRGPAGIIAPCYAMSKTLRRS